MAYTLVPTELIQDGAVTSAKLDTNIAISGTLSVGGVTTLATHLVMGDNDKIKIGTGGDLEIYHDASNSYIANSTGNLYIGDTNGSVHIQAKLNEDSIVAAADGAVTLYYDNAPKLATTSTGIDVTGNASFADNGKAIFGDSADLQIFHSGANSYINETGTGSLITQASDIFLRAGGTNNTNNAIVMSNGGTVTLFNANNAKLATTSTGIDVTGTATMDGLTVDGTGTITFNDVGENIFSPSAGILAIESRGQVQIWGDTNNNGASTSAVFEILRDSTYAGGTGKQTLTAYDNGDISFYEDTGSTAKLFWDASAESLGIGTTSPLAALEVSRGSAPHAAIIGASQGSARVVLFKDNHASPNKYNWLLGSQYNVNNAFEITPSTAVGGTTFTAGSGVSILQTGNVGIGLTTPAEKLTVFGNILVNAGYGNGFFLNDNSKITRENGGMAFTANNVERMRIQSNGNISIGGTASGGTPNLQFYHNDSLRAYIRATSAAGMLIDSDSAITFNTNNTARWIMGSSGHITPNNQHAYDIGGTNAEVRNIYAQGISFASNAHAGGMSSELLDDYEEGSWTGTLTGASSAPSTAVTATGYYTKIGNMVTLWIEFNNTNITGASGTVKITGQPFTPASAKGSTGGGYASRGATTLINSYITSSSGGILFVNYAGSAASWATTGTGTYVQATITFSVS